MAEKKKVNKTKQKFADMLSQAKESLKLLGTLEKEAVAKARKLVKLPSAAERKKLTNEKILSGLKKLGVATQGELEELQTKVQKLETELHHKEHGSHKHSSSRSSSASA